MNGSNLMTTSKYGPSLSLVLPFLAWEALLPRPSASTSVTLMVSLYTQGNAFEPIGMLTIFGIHAVLRETSSGL